MSLKNKTALITGASSGIGEACAYALKEEGARLILTGRNKIKLEELAKKMDASFIVADLQDNSEVEKLFNEAGTSIDILVNNAGTNRPENFSKVKTKDMNYVVDLNIKAAFNVAQLATKIMLKTKKRKALGGSIINMSSQLGKVGAPNRSVYNMTKFGIEGLTKGMAIDLAKNNIRVNSICPTFVETPLVKKFFKDKQFKKAMIDNIPLGRLATESDIATAVVYLASNASSMLTGSSLVIDGGWTAK